MKKAVKGQPIMDQEEKLMNFRQQKKKKNKKKKKQHIISTQQTKNDLTKSQQKNQNHKNKKPQQDKETKMNRKKQEKKQMDSISHQLSLLTFTPDIAPSQAACVIINSHLEELTINLYQTMIMKPSLITKAIELAKKELLTPKEYFAIDYTNKLLLIKELLKENSATKYNKFIEMIDREVERVQGLILRCMGEVVIFDEVLSDLKKNNIQWQPNHKEINLLKGNISSQIH